MEEKRQNGKKGHKKAIFVTIGIVLVVGVVILILLFLMQGNTTTTSEKIENTKTTALSCSSTTIKYPIFTYDNTDKREMNVKLVFGKESLKTIALDYSLFYGDANSIEASEAHNHAAMNISFGKNGLEPDEFDAKYTTLSDRMRMNLYASGSDINEAAAKYFLIDAENGTPETLEEYQQNYVAQGFRCEAME